MTTWKQLMNDKDENIITKKLDEWDMKRYSHKEYIENKFDSIDFGVRIEHEAEGTSYIKRHPNAFMSLLKKKTKPKIIRKKMRKQPSKVQPSISQEQLDKQADFVIWQTKLYNEPLHDLNESVQRNEPEPMRIK